MVATTGTPVGVSVVKVLSLPYLVPLLLIPTSRKWYVVFGLNPVMFALTLCGLVPL
jgi:hypothetical protein